MLNLLTLRPPETTAPPPRPKRGPNDATPATETTPGMAVMLFELGSKCCGVCHKAIMWTVRETCESCRGWVVTCLIQVRFAKRLLICAVRNRAPELRYLKVESLRRVAA